MSIIDGVLELAWWQMILSAVVLVIGAARLTRLITHDTFPPVVWLRIQYENRVPEEWGTLVHCHWCMGPWMTLIALLTFLPTVLVPWVAVAWWLFYGWMALSYLTSQYVHFDEGSSSE